VAALTSFFASFSSAYLTAAFTFVFFVVGREADALGHLPVHFVGPLGRDVGRAFARIIPNLQLYVPPRALLLGEVPETPVWSFVAHAARNALLYAVSLVTLGAVFFQRRDFP